MINYVAEVQHAVARKADASKERRDAHPGGVEKLRQSRTTVAKETHNGGVINIRSTIDSDSAVRGVCDFSFTAATLLRFSFFFDRTVNESFYSQMNRYIFPRSVACCNL